MSDFLRGGERRKREAGPSWGCQIWTSVHKAKKPPWNRGGVCSTAWWRARGASARRQQQHTLHRKEGDLLCNRGLRQTRFPPRKWKGDDERQQRPPPPFPRVLSGQVEGVLRPLVTLIRHATHIPGSHRPLPRHPTGKPFTSPICTKLYHNSRCRMRIHTSACFPSTNPPPAIQ